MREKYFNFQINSSFIVKISKNYQIFLIVLFAFFSVNNSVAQTAGPNNAGIGTNTIGTGTISWSNPNYILADDTSYSTSILTLGQSTQYLQGTNYGFAIPAGVVINGIAVSILRQSNASSISDGRVQLVKNGTIVGNNYGTAAIWSTTMTTENYGSPTDLWGTTWTATDINNANFGIVLSAVASANEIASVDYIQITIYYTPTPTITSFTPTNSCIGTATSVVLTGNNFNGATAVNFNVLAASYTVNSNTQITAVLPASATTGPITVTTPSGTTASLTDFTVTPNNTISLSSAAGTNAQTKCISIPITDITYTTTGATGATFSGLPAGVSGSFNSNTVTITGSPSVSGTFNYTVNLTGGCGTVNAAGTITITPNANIASVTGTTPLCIGATATYTANGVVLGGGSGAWSSSNIAVVTVNAFTGLVTGGSAGTADIIYTITGGCSGSKTAQQSITITPNSSITSITGTTPLCIGATATYTANGVVLGGGSGAWSSSNTAVATVNASTGLVTGGSAGTADIIYNITGGCSGTKTAQQSVTITPNSSITSVTGTTPLCIGATATYTANGIVLGGGTGAWSSSNTAVATVNSSGLITAVSAGTANIIFTITGCNGPASKLQAITVNPNATITSVIGTTTLCIGATATYTSNGVVLGGGTGAWSSSNTSFATVNAATGLVTGISAGTANIIYTVTGCNGTPSSFQAITINEITIITSQPTSTTVCVGSSVTITVAANGANLTYQWQINTSGNNYANISGETNSALNFVSVTTLNAAKYKCIITGSCGTLTSNIITLTVNPVPTANISGTTVVCKDATVPNVTFTGSSGTAPYTFTYNINGGSNLTVTTISGSSVTVPAQTATAGTFIYNLKSVKDASSTICSQAQTGTATITVNPLPTATITGIIAVCKDATAPNVTFTGAAGTAPYTFTYKINSGSNLTITTTGVNSSVTVTAPTGTAGSFIYNLLSIKDATSSNCSQAQTGTATITVNPLPTASISGTTAVCKNAIPPNVTFTAAAGTAPYTFTYKINSGGTLTVTTTSGSSVTAPAPTTTAGTFIYTLVSVLDASSTNCSQAQTGTVTIIVNPLPTAGISGTIAVCKNVTAPNVIFTGAAGTAPYTFTYNINGGSNLTVTTISGSSVTVAAPTATAGTFIYNLVSVKDAISSNCSQAQTGTAIITVNPLPTASIGGTTAVCKNAISPNVTFTGAAGTTPYTFTYKINSGGNLTVVTTSGSSVTIPVPTTTAGTFIYTLISVQDSSTTTCSQIQGGTATITINPLPTANISGTTTVCKDATVPNVTFTGAAGTAPYTFTYNVNGSSNLTVTTISGSSVTVAAPTATAGTFIYNLVSVKDDSLTICSQAQTGTATITVNPTPLASATPASQTICSETQLLSISLSSSVASSTFNWTRNNTTNVTGITPSGTGDIGGYLTNNTPFDQTITFTIIPTANGCIGTPVTAIVLVKAVPIEGVITFSNLSDGSSTATGCQLASGTLYLSGNTGTVARWEKSITAGTSWSTIAASGGITEYNYSGLTETTKYRVVLTNGLNNCPVVYSASE